MKNKIKAILLILALALLGFSMGLFFLAQKIEPAAIKKKTLEVLQKSSPETDFVIGEVDYSLGFSVSFYLKNIIARQDKTQVAKVEWIELKMPLWAIYFGGGNLDIRVVGSDFQKYEAPEKKKSLSLNNIHNNITAEKLELPELFSRNKVNIRFTDLSYTSEKTFKVDTLLFKDLGKKGVTAFEIIKNNQENTFNPYTSQVVGEIDLRKLFEENVANISFFANINNLKIHDGKVSFPDIKFSGTGELKSNGDLRASIEVKSNDLVQMKLNAFLSEKLWKFDQVAAKFDLKALFKSFLVENKKFSFDDSSLSFEGGFDYMPLEKNLDLDLKFEIDKLVYVLEKNISISNSFQGKLIGKRLEAKAKSDLFKGVAITDIVGDLSFQSGYKLDRVARLSLSSSFSNIRLSKSEINNYLYREIQNKEPLNKRLLLPELKWIIDGKHIFIDDIQYSFNGSVEYADTKLKIANSSINSQDGEIKIEGMGEFQNADNYQLQLKGGVRDFHISNMIFLTPTWMQAELVGKLNGEYHFYIKNEGGLRDFSYDFNGNLNSGNIKAYNLTDFYNKKYPSNPKLKYLSDDFKKSKLHFYSTTQKTMLAAVLEYSSKDRFNINAEIMHDPSLKSEVETYFEKKKNKELPLTFNGLGKNLAPVL